MSRELELGQALGVNHQIGVATVGRIEQFIELALKWNSAINLVGRSTAAQMWERHVIDSAQIFKCASETQRVWLDLGSGGGFPGIVIAVLAAEIFPQLRVSLVESDKRKAVFLSEAGRQLGLKLTVHANRIQDLEPQHADVVSARALAALEDLCAYATSHLNAGGVCAFPKGASAQEEIETARKTWSFNIDQVASITDSRASVLFLKDLKRV